MKRLALIFLLALSCGTLKAQFSLTGEDPGNVKWMRMDSPNFRLIYPEGEDSLAVVYGSWLEKARTAVGWSSGMRIGEYHSGRLPVVLHSFNPVANASVAWAPKRMDIYTVLDPYSPTPIPWEKLLAIHEGRHASQMQAGAGGGFKVFNYLVGELIAGAVAGLYPGPTLLEGDAVTTETAMTQSGRGRQASFLEYMVPALDRGDYRDYWRWSLGSDRYYTPDHYRAGYLLVSGMRVFFDDPLFTQEYFSRVRKMGLFVLNKTAKATSGMNLTKSFNTILAANHDIWNAEADARGPFMVASQVSTAPWRHTAYSGTVIDKDGVLWSKKGGLTVANSLVRSSASGEETRVRSFASYTSPLAYDRAGDKVWWSENVPHFRWSLGGSSRIRFVDTSNPAKVHDLTTSGRYFNPAPSPDGQKVAVTEYPHKGGSRIVVLSSFDGAIERIIEAPDSLQFTEAAWINDKLYAAGLSDYGMGIYALDPIREIVGPQPVELSTLRPFQGAGLAEGPALTFICDRTGARELYLLEIGSGKLSQVTSSRYGISSPVFNNAADTLFYSSLAPSDNPESYKQGWMIYATPVKDLTLRQVSFDDIHKYPVAETLSTQEKTLAGDAWDAVFEQSEPSFSEPRRHRKLSPVIHSWAPVYFNYDNVESTSLDEYYKTTSLGATAIFQNLVGDGAGFVGYNVHPDPDLEGIWRHSGHIKYTYNGLFPVVELSADFGDRAAKYYQRVQQVRAEDNAVAIFTGGKRIASRPYLDSSLKLYIPFNFSSGGISRGLVPQVKYRFTNDRINDKISFRVEEETDGQKTVKEVSTLYQDNVSYVSTLDFSLRGYVMRAKAPAQAYPSLGIGAEVGLRTRPGHALYYGNTAYIYTYGYLPGILQDQGIRLSATFGAKVGGGEVSFPDSPVNFVPRGFTDSNIRSVLNSCSPMRYKLTFDYAIKFLNLDWSGICPIAYLKNFTLTPFADYSYAKFDVSDKYLINNAKVQSENLISVGADLALNLGNFFWLPYDTQIGVRYARNFWKEIGKFKTEGLMKDYFGAIFSVSL